VKQAAKGKSAAAGEKEETLTTGAKPAESSLPMGKASVLVDGKEHVFDLDHPEFPEVLKDIGRLSLLAKASVAQETRIVEEKEKLGDIKKEILLELKNEGRSSFAYRQGSMTYTFEIEAKPETLVIKKRK
jgi:hypothetical protein